MTQEEFEAATARLLAVNELIKNLDPAIKEKSFDILRAYVAGTTTLAKVTTTAAVGDDESQPNDSTSDDLETFFANFDHDKPSDNVFLITAHLYKTFGDSQFTVKDVQNLAGEVGIILPDRPDVTLNSAQRNGKALFNRIGRGIYKPTVHGAAFFKETYGVKRGRAKKEGSL